MKGNRFLSDITAGLTVSFAAISLGAAFGIMSGRGAFAGMIAAAVIPIVASTFGGTRLQASGPTAPMTAVSALVIAFAYDRFEDKALAEQFITLIFILNAMLICLAGLLRLGKLIKLVPNVIILGFMNGIAFLIWKDQLTKVFATGEREVLKGGIVLNVVLMLATFALIYLIVWAVKKAKLPPAARSLISGVLWSIILMTVIAVAWNLPAEKVRLGSSVASIAEFGRMVAAYFPSKEIWTLEYLLLALPYAAELTLLAYLDSLLTALIIERITGERSKLNKELVAQGLANGTAAVLQGIPGAQATIRSVLLIKEGAQTRFAGVLIGVFALLSILVFKDYLTLVPQAVFMGVLLKAGLDVCDKDFISSYFRGDWRRSMHRNLQLLFIAYATLVTLFIDLNIAVVTGTLLFYVAKYFWKIQDVEDNLTEVSEAESKVITN